MGVPKEAKWVISERLVIAETAWVVIKKLYMGHTREVTRTVPKSLYVPERLYE